jgi:hypothetical protein
MCDYSLHQNRTRLAEDGEELVVHRFSGGSLGLASPKELNAKTAYCSQYSGAPCAWSWSRVTSLFRWANGEASRVTAVCIPPGSRLVLRDIGANIQKQMGVEAEEYVVFDQLSADASTYRDCVTFRNGQKLSLQRLRPGQRVDVLTLTPAEVRTNEERFITATRPVSG